MRKSKKDKVGIYLWKLVLLIILIFVIAISLEIFLLIERKAEEIFFSSTNEYASSQGIEEEGENEILESTNNETNEEFSSQDVKEEGKTETLENTDNEISEEISSEETQNETSEDVNNITNENVSSQEIEEETQTEILEEIDNTKDNDDIKLVAGSDNVQTIKIHFYDGNYSNDWVDSIAGTEHVVYADSTDENVYYISLYYMGMNIFGTGDYSILYYFYEVNSSGKKTCTLEEINGEPCAKIVLDASKECNIYYLPGYVLQSVVSFDGTNGGIYSNENFLNMPFDLSTLKVELPTSEEFSSNKFKLAGWYDITNNRYYDSSYLGKEVTTTENAIFYADWISNNYNNGTLQEGKIESADTEGFVNISIFDYNELFNISSCDYNNPAWIMKDIQNGFVFVNGNSRLNGTLSKPHGTLTEGIVSNWTGTEGEPYQGILEKHDTLLNQLFDESGNTPGVHYLGKADGLFYLNDEGYYEYDSAKHMASYNKENQRFTVYDSPQNIDSFSKCFLPLNGESPNYGTNDVNYWFGMKTEITFNLEADTGTNQNIYNGEDIIFTFSGDDDTWVFIDDELVLDIGGIHDPCSGTINFNTGECFINEEKIEKSISLSAGVHSLKVYYMERGTGASNLRISFCSALLNQATSLKKEVNKKLVDYSENIIYTLKYENIGKNDINKSYGYDIFPFNRGIHGTVAKGKMYLEKLVSNHSSIDSSATLKIYYSTTEGKFLQRLISTYGLDDQTGRKIEEMLENGYLSEDNNEIIIQNNNSANYNKIFEYLGTLDNNNTFLTNENQEITCIYIVAENFKKSSKLRLDCYMKIDNGGQSQDISGDRYFNKAFSIIANNKANEYDESNVVSTAVISRAISGMVWNDENGNGIREENEKPIEGVVATLLKYDQKNSTYSVCDSDLQGNKIEPITTTQDGMYEFDKLPAGEYIVAFNTNNANYAITKYQVNGINDANTNDGVKTDNLEEYDFAIKYSLEQQNIKLHITDELSEDMLDDYKEKIINQDLGLCEKNIELQLPVTGGGKSIYFIVIGLTIMITSGKFIFENKGKN